MKRHIFGLIVPDLLVVGNHVGLRDSPAECVIYPFPEVFRFLELAFFERNQVLYELVYAEESVFGGKVVQPVLEGILHVCAFKKDLRISLSFVFVLREHVAEKVVDLFIAAENNMRAADIKSKAVFGLGATKSARIRLFFEDGNVMSPEGKSVCKRNSGETAAKYCNFHNIM